MSNEIPRAPTGAPDSSPHRTAAPSPAPAAGISAPHPPPPRDGGTDPSERRAARRFLLTVLALILAGAGVLAGGHMALARIGRLPDPPLTATWCIDEKLAALRDVALEDRVLLALGSSATWRNLDMPLIAVQLGDERVYNAAPCYLHIDQTAFLASFLLDRAPQVRTVMVVLAPRDFESCPAEATAFFDTALGDAYLSGLVPSWLPYVTGFRPLYRPAPPPALSMARRSAPRRWRRTGWAPASCATRIPGAPPPPSTRPATPAGGAGAGGGVARRAAGSGHPAGDAGMARQLRPRWPADRDLDAPHARDAAPARHAAGRWPRAALDG
ncbi:hypothetical protein [Teichococcus aestuarii]|uniref:hypothetical protein n=1 Tax=Teichococcus aestuarii TaxID=568898 RepID=UPI00360CBF9F